MFATLLLVVLVITAAITDAARHTIYNWTTYPGMLAGLALAAIGAAAEQLAPESAAAWQPLVGWLSWTDALGGFLVCGCLMVVCFVFFPMGGGDVKLLAALGAWLGPRDAVYLALFSSLAGGVAALVYSVMRGYGRQALSNIWLMLTHWRVVGLRPVPGLTLRDGRAPRLAYAIPIAVGVLCTLWLH